MIKKLELYVEAKITMPFYPEDFERGDVTFDEFFNKIVSDLNYKKDTFIDCILNLSDDIIDDIVTGVGNNTFPVIVQIKKEDEMVPGTVRDLE